MSRVIRCRGCLFLAALFCFAQIAELGSADVEASQRSLRDEDYGHVHAIKSLDEALSGSGDNADTLSHSLKVLERGSASLYQMLKREWTPWERNMARDQRSLATQKSIAPW